jgi:hypothetical protein
MTKQPSVIKFQATVYKVQTLVDNGLRLTLDLSEKELNTAKAMMECKNRGALLEVAAVPVIIKLEEKPKDEPAKRRKQRYPYRTK